MSGSCSTHGEIKSVYKTLVGEPGGKRPLGNLGVNGRILLEWTLEK